MTRIRPLSDVDGPVRREDAKLVGTGRKVFMGWGWRAEAGAF